MITKSKDARRVLHAVVKYLLKTSENLVAESKRRKRREWEQLECLRRMGIRGPIQANGKLSPFWLIYQNARRNRLRAIAQCNQNANTLQALGPIAEEQMAKA